MVRAWSAIMALVICVGAPAFADDVPRYSHRQHDAAVPECTSCHVMNAGNGWISPFPVSSGKKGHEPCSSCHEHERMFGPTGRRDNDKRLAFCATCHPSGGRDFRRTRYPPYRERGESEFWLASYDHGKHLQNTSCESCHKPEAGKGVRMALPDHAACATAGCHGGPAKPAMNACTACHARAPAVGTPAGGTPVAALASRAPTPFRVGATFAHVAHAASSKQFVCVRCHSNVAVGASATIPLPPMITCESCHDGTNAFYALGTGCMKCHRLSEAEQRAARVTPQGPPPIAFSHTRHASKGVPLACESCHFSTPSGRLKFPVPDDHRPCSNCHQHQEAYRTQSSPMCRVCHEHSDPFRPNPLRTSFRASTELVTTFGHASHAQVDCATCHPKNAGQARATPPGILAPSHELCSSCHEKLQKPAMTSCAGCHALPKVDGAASNPWKVAAKFMHQTHTTDIRTAAVVQPNAAGWARVDRAGAQRLDCAKCHANVKMAKLGEPVPAPTMQGCADCHQGTWAFKTTGTGCISCHGPAVQMGSL